MVRPIVPSPVPTGSGSPSAVRRSAARVEANFQARSGAGPGRRRLPGGRTRRACCWTGRPGNGAAHVRLVVVLVDVEQVVGAALEGQQLQGEARELDGDRIQVGPEDAVRDHQCPGRHERVGTLARIHSMKVNLPWWPPLRLLAGGGGRAVGGSAHRVASDADPRPRRPSADHAGGTVSSHGCHAGRGIPFGAATEPETLLKWSDAGHKNSWPVVHRGHAGRGWLTGGTGWISAAARR
jgi:hypothetical protein